MKYIFNEDYNKPIKQRILEINNIQEDKLDTSDFVIDYNQKQLNNFKQILLENRDKKFLIVGDYDCDGICATTIIKKLLDDLSIKNNYYIPSRCKEGYGLNKNIVNTAYENKFDCLFCVDNGIVADEEIKLAKVLGIKTFIIDHHEYEHTPICECFLHPNLFDEKYSDMCAAGLCALLSNSFRYDEMTTAYGGLATLADMVSVLNYNRVLIKQMLEIVKQDKIAPINLLLGDKDVTYTNIQFNVIPKINAVSRLDDLMNVNYVVKFLLADVKEALPYFDKIETINRARKDYSSTMYNLACSQIGDDDLIVIKNSEFKEGLCGLVANRILENYKKPTIVLCEDNGLLKGSGRSVPGSNLYEYLCKCKDLFETFGGHELAVGLTIKIENYERFIEYIKNNRFEYCEQCNDVLLLNQQDIDFNLVNALNELEPFGTNFKMPQLGMYKPIYQSRYIVAGKYPKFNLNDCLSAISFNNKFIDSQFDYMIGKLTVDNYNGTKLSFIIEDLV